MATVAATMSPSMMTGQIHERRADAGADGQVGECCEGQDERANGDDDCCCDAGRDDGAGQGAAVFAGDCPGHGFRRKYGLFEWTIVSDRNPRFIPARWRPSAVM
jgi:hypothetical protein